MKKVASTFARNQRGFTLIELIVVIIVLGILSTFALSRFQGRGGFVEYTYQDRLVSTLRNMQQRAMHDTANVANDSLYRVVVSDADGEFGPPLDALNLNTIDHSNDALSSVPGEISEQGVTITLQDVTQAASFSFIRFDSMGRPINDFGNNSCISGCQINFVGQATASLCVEQQGYVHPGNCNG